MEQTLRPAAPEAGDPPADGRAPAREVLHLLKTVGNKAQELAFKFTRLADSSATLFCARKFRHRSVVEGDGIVLGRRSPRSQGKIRIHKKFGTATCTSPAGTASISPRAPGVLRSPRGAPRVEHSSIKLDLYRRDFTVNAWPFT